MNNIVKTIFFISAVSPVLLVAGAVRTFETGIDSLSLQLACVGFIGALLPFLILKLLKNLSETFPLQIKKVKSSDELLIGFAISYLLPILKLAAVGQTTLIIAALVITTALWMISKIPSHPILYLFNYRFFEVESEQGVVYVLIAKRTIRNPGTIKIVKQLTDSMLMEA